MTYQDRPSVLEQVRNLCPKALTGSYVEWKEHRETCSVHRAYIGKWLRVAASLMVLQSSLGSLSILGSPLPHKKSCIVGPGVSFRPGLDSATMTKVSPEVSLPGVVSCHCQGVNQALPQGMGLSNKHLREATTKSLRD